jgi:hypothetical protein
MKRPELSFATQGRPDLLTQEDKEFMTDLVNIDPGLFLDEI